MARINIEDSLFKDRRFLKLLARLGCEYKALGMISSAWILAQENWLKHKQIPAKAWPIELDILIEVELAERTLTGDVYVKGSKAAFAWLEQKSKAGKSKSSKKTQNLNKGTKKTPNGRSSGPERAPNGSEPLTLTHSPTLTPIHSLSDNSQSSLNKEIWDAYRDAYFARYKVDPVRNASVNAKISQLGKRLGADAVDVVKFYLSHNDSFYLKNLHSIGLCLSNAESLHTQMLRGRAITGNDVKEFEKQDHFNQQIQRIKEGKI